MATNSYTYFYILYSIYESKFITVCVSLVCEIYVYLISKNLIFYFIELTNKIEIFQVTGT